MAYPTSPAPCYPIDEHPTDPEVLITTHRDGSEQRRYKGAGKLRTWKLSYGTDAPISNTERETLFTYWASKYTLYSFSWTHPERTSETYTVRFASKPTFRLVGYNSYQGEVTLQEVPA